MASIGRAGRMSPVATNAVSSIGPTSWVIKAVFISVVDGIVAVVVVDVEVAIEG